MNCMACIGKSTGAGPATLKYASAAGFWKHSIHLDISCKFSPLNKFVTFSTFYAYTTNIALVSL